MDPITRGLVFASCIVGMLGTISLYLGSYAYEAVMVFMSEKEAKIIDARNRKRRILQRLGIGLLFVSYLLTFLALCR